MSAIQYPYVYNTGHKRKHPLDGLILNVFVQFTENSGVFRCDTVDCFIRSNDQWLFESDLDSKEFCEKVAKEIQRVYTTDHDALKNDVHLYGRI